MCLTLSNQGSTLYMQPGAEKGRPPDIKGKGKGGPGARNRGVIVDLIFLSQINSKHESPGVIKSPWPTN